jgi:hypothetical protein
VLVTNFHFTPVQWCRWKCTPLALEGVGQRLEDMVPRRHCEVRSLSRYPHPSLFDYLLGRSYREEPGQGHWYSSVFNNEQVMAFLDAVLVEERQQPPQRPATFTLTTAVPAETGSLHGWRILRWLVPGR